MEPGVSDDAGAVYRCKSEEFTSTTVNCVKVESTEVLSLDFDLIADGIAIDDDGHLYFTAYNLSDSYLFKLSGIDRDYLETLPVRRNPGNPSIEPGNPSIEPGNPSIEPGNPSIDPFVLCGRRGPRR
eukprot:1180691-Prorocentrum_minimum.AAC.1